MKKRIANIIIILILITVVSILHFTSDATNLTLHQLYKLLYFIPVIFAAIMFGFRGGTSSALLISVIYSPQKLLSIGMGGEALNELMDIFLFFSVGIVTGILVEKKNLAVQAIDNQLKKYVILENYTNSVLESIKVGIIAINNDYFITSINTGAMNILGVTNDCIGMNFVEAFSCCEDIEPIIVEAMNDNATLVNLERNLLKGDKEVNIKIDTFPLNLENKNKGLVITIEDITEIKKIKSQMNRNDKLASVGQLATGIAHEIRNPLAIIKMIEQTMSKELEGNKSALDELKVIDEEVERANKVIKSLMEFSKPSKNEKANHSIIQIIEDVLVITNKYTAQHMVNISFKQNGSSERVVDREQLIQVFINLIFNAVDAMPKGGEINIITQSLPENKIKIIFEDTGQGIDNINLDKIFDLFFTTKAEGTGLGLPIVYRFIEDHEGSINVKSVRGKGTIFEIIL